MGATIDTFIAKTDKETTAKHMLIDHKCSLQYEYGHNPYNGTLSTCNGLQFIGTFDDVRVAYEHMQDEAQKWGPILGARIENPSGVEYLFVGLCGC